MSPGASQIRRTITYWFFRLLLGGAFLAAALGKSLDMPGFIDVLRTYHAFPDPLLRPFAIFVIGIEWVLSLCLMSGRWLRQAALGSAILNSFYAAWMIATLFRGLDVPNCGCFGVFFPQPLRWYSSLEDLVLAAMSLALWGLSKRGESRGFSPC